MKNDRGYAVLLIMFLIAVISIVGVGLVFMSRLDMKFTGALTNYDKLINLADGGTSMASNDMRLTSREAQLNYTGLLPCTIAGVYKGEEHNVGEWQVDLTLQGFDDSAKAQPGWDASQGSGGNGYHRQFWIGKGKGIRSGGTLVAEVDATKRRGN